MPDTLQTRLERFTQEGELYEKLSHNKVRCYACGHCCLITDGKQGICRVRFNRGGKLFVPSGYVAALQVDPIEKKPFFHALPGAKALSFGMLGCDFHCGYCFTPGTRVPTAGGIFSIADIVRDKISVKVYTHGGRKRDIKNFFERPYHGHILKIKPAFLPRLECTPDHPLLVRLRPDRFATGKPGYLAAGKLTKDHCLVIPKHYEFSEDKILEAGDYLRNFLKPYRVRHKIPAEILEQAVDFSSEGKSSREIGSKIGKSASHVRHLLSKLRKGVWDIESLGIVNRGLVLEDGRIRFPKEHTPGIPSHIPLVPELAELLGFYCAEGSVSLDKGRVHSADLSFSFGKTERDLAVRVKDFLNKIFGGKACLVQRETTLSVSSGKTSLALLFKALCGERGSKKKVPELLFNAKRDVVESFLRAYVAGDGYRAPDGQIRISTISEELSWGIAWLVQKLGYLPQCHKYPAVPERKLLGRDIKQFPWTYLVRWYESSKKQRHVWEDGQYRYVLVEKIEQSPYEGPVYNLETEEDHTYLANFVAVHNCQNWVTSQALRDPVAGVQPEEMTPEQFVNLAKEHGAQVVTSTYNEPLITSEWAVEIFKQAKKEGLYTSYVSNGNGTPEVIEYIRPWIDFYKVDLKGFDDKGYRSLGGELSKVLDTIRLLHAKGVWVEIVTLVIPGFNDSDEELTKIAEFLVSVSPDIPWHVTAFHKDYKMTDSDNTGAETLTRASGIGKKAGLHFVYAGNLPGCVSGLENTYCPGCNSLLIERHGFRILKNKLTRGRCPKCNAAIPGVWSYDA